MSLLTLLLVVVLLGVLAYVIGRLPWVAPPFKGIAIVVCIIIAGFLVLNAFGVLDALSGVRVPRVSH